MKTQNTKKKRYQGLNNIGYALNQVIKPFSKRNLTLIVPIIKNWENIIGKKYSKFCEPEKIRFKKGEKGNGELYISVFNPAIALYLDSNELYICEKIASYFGYKIVSKIRLIQRPKLVKNINTRQSLQNKKVSEKILNKVETVTAEIENPILKKALEDLGKVTIKD